MLRIVVTNFGRVTPYLGFWIEVVKRIFPTSKQNFGKRQQHDDDESTSRIESFNQ
jgi:hypothetical protein